MDPSQFPGNSKRPQREAPPEKKVERVVVTDAVTRKKGIGRRLRETFIGGDSGSVFQYVMMEVLVPQAKDMVSEAVTQAIDRLIFGEGRGARNRYGGRGSAPTNYSRYSGRGNNPIGRTIGEERTPLKVRNRGLDDIFLQTRVEAEEVHERMFDLLENYNVVTVSDLYSMVGLTPSHVDTKWGWENLEGSNVQKVRGGYILNLPKPEPLDP